MTIPETTPAPVPDAPACPACPHALDVHGPVGVRFCAVTTARHLDRGCACAR